MTRAQLERRLTAQRANLDATRIYYANLLEAMKGKSEPGDGHEELINKYEAIIRRQAAAVKATELELGLLPAAKDPNQLEIDAKATRAAEAHLGPDLGKTPRTKA